VIDWLEIPNLDWQAFGHSTFLGIPNLSGVEG
jgi:hypothetical protein